jgi:hypothetical protein
VPHMSLVFREMWDTMALHRAVFPAYRLVCGTITKVPRKLSRTRLVETAKNPRMSVRKIFRNPLDTISASC